MKKIVSALAAVAILASAGASFAADAPAAGAAAPVAAKVAPAKLTRKEVSEIVKACKTENAKDKKAFKSCVAAKKKAAADAPKAETTAPAAAN